MTNLEITIKQLYKQHVTLDCNILLLYIIGSIEKSHIRKYKRTQSFLEEDYDLLISLIKNSIVILTPNVISEASDLLDSYSPNGQKIGLLKLKRIICEVFEDYTPSKTLVELSSYLKFGLSDSSIDQLCKRNIIAITTDSHLYGFLINQSYKAINFNHVRGESLLK